jgi:AcrR family transcriptional regulator
VTNATTSAIELPGTRRYGRRTADERRQARRARLLEAALEAFGTRGYAATSIEQLCAAAGISARSFYEEFASREALLVALHDVLNERAFDHVVAAVGAMDATDIAGRARSGVRAYFGVMTSDPRCARLALVESVGVSPQVEAHRRQALARFAGLLEAEAVALADRGLVPRREWRLTAVGLVGAINELVNTWTASQEWSEAADSVAEEAVRFILAALGRPVEE